MWTEIFLTPGAQGRFSSGKRSGVSVIRFRGNVGLTELRLANGPLSITNHLLCRESEFPTLEMEIKFRNIPKQRLTTRLWPSGPAYKLLIGMFRAQFLLGGAFSECATPAKNFWLSVIAIRFVPSLQIGSGKSPANRKFRKTERPPPPLSHFGGL